MDITNILSTLITTRGGNVKASIINFSQLKNPVCWSAKRFVGNCKECKGVEFCSKKPGRIEAKIGRIQLLKEKEEKLEEEFNTRRENYIKEQSKLMRDLENIDPKLTEDL